MKGVIGIHGNSHFVRTDRARIVALLCFPAIALAALCLTRGFPLSAPARVAAALSPLLWSGGSLPVDLVTGNWEGVYDPYIHAALGAGDPSGSLYHNLTQQLAVAMAITALLPVAHFLSRGAVASLALGCALLVASAHVKPTSFSMLGPALLIVLAAARARATAWALALGVFAAGMAAYFAPGLMLRVPGQLRGGDWEIVWSALSDERLLAGRALILGFAIPVLLFWLVDWVRRVRDRCAMTWSDVAALAALGGVAFATLFVERGRVMHGNQLWGMYGQLAMLAPFVFATGVGWTRRLFAGAAGWPGRALRVHFNAWAEVCSWPLESDWLLFDLNSQRSPTGA